ncbi:MAG: zinc-dependent peptidase [Polaromonas sp.]|jgi:Mlc titration factor MtfA (ptsG expression regulator)|uniref:M90 family metallopeptidase n=1 Tax=Polaromonas sp. TaxID=1869339 RepID=UPI00273038BD|nr:M90 family metallopeptidase [Polaromonas sp.]MDP2256875.1 zinc-dependent peptidase [Polaromonas sp.]
MLNWLQSLLGRGNGPPGIPEALWHSTLLRYPFLARRPVADHIRLRALVSRFLAHKEFSGAHGLIVTDEMAVAIAAQACLPVLHLGLRWYDDFKGIVVHPGAMLARRQTTDQAGVVHYYSEALLGEAMERGPVTLSWQDVAAAGDLAEQGHNVVIHEFVHKIDMRDGLADGCPPLPSRAAHTAWHAVMQPAYDSFCEQVAMAKRFGGQQPWLDSYGATAPAEFFAVACEGYFVQRDRFTQDFAALTTLFDQFFKGNRPTTK